MCQSISLNLHTVCPKSYWVLVDFYFHCVYHLHLRMPSSGMLRHVALVITDVSEEPSTSIIRVTRIGELGTTLAVTNSKRTLLKIC
jgi:hypothetical protein